MRSLLFAILAITTVCGCSPEIDGSTSGSGATRVTPVNDPLQQPFSSGTDATAWIMDMKHTLRGMTIEEAQKLIKDLMDLGAVEIKVDDIQPDPADQSYSSAGRMIVRGPRNSDHRKAIIDFANKWNNNEPAQTSIDSEFAQLSFPRK